jgi:folate-binding protein YgfZ
MSQPLSPCRWSTPVSLIRLEGADVLRFLHGQSSQALAQASPGQTLATALTSPTARMRGLALVLVREGAADLLVLSGDGQAIRQGLDRVLFPADQVTLAPPEPALLVRWLGASPPEGDAAAGSGEAATSQGGQGGELLRPGVDLGAGADQPALLLRGQEQLPDWLAQLPQLSGEAIELQRIRSGFPSQPEEINDDTNPFELGLAGWVSLNKGCYVGQETLAKLATYDGVKQQLRHWRWQPNPAAPAPMPERGASITTADGQRAGAISSCLATAAGAEGLALVRRVALDQPELWAGAARLTISTPPAFVPPPRRAGGRL